MALFGILNNPMECFASSGLLDQQFDLENFLEAYPPHEMLRLLLTAPQARNCHSQAAEKNKTSTVSLDKDKFQVSLDVQQFTPEEIKVKASGDMIIVEGKHEEKEDEHGTISRQFVRKYTLPEGHNSNLVESKLSSDGILTITAPKIEKEVKEKEIPISLTGEPTRPSKEVVEEEKKDN